MNEMDNDRSGHHQYCSGCLRTYSLSADGDGQHRIDHNLHRPVGRSWRSTVIRDEEEAARWIRWGIIAVSFIGFVGGFIQTVVGG